MRIADGEDKVMNQRVRSEINWVKWMDQIGSFFWGVTGYVGLIAGAIFLASAYAKGMSHERAVAAVMGVLFGTMANWLVFGMVEYRHLKRMNDEL